MIRQITEKEKNEVFKKVALGWANVGKEVEEGFYFQPAQIEGEIPLQLKGTFVRNGPGLTNVYGTQLSHPIDGDGLIASLTFFEGKVFFQSKFVQTKSHVDEAKAKKMLFDGQMGSRAPPESKKMGFRDPSHTNVFYHGGKLFATHEYTLPHTINPSNLETLGQDSLNNNLELRTMSAHFRYDADLDVLVTTSFKPGNLTRNSRVSFYEWDRNLALKRTARLEIQYVNYVHDFVLTPNYYLVHVSPFVDTSPETLKLLSEGKILPGETMRYIPGNPSQFVLIERFPKIESQRKIQRFHTEPCHIYHFAHCIEDLKSGKIKFQACCLPLNFNMEWQYQAFLSNTSDAPGLMHSYEIDPKTGGILRHPTPGLESTSCEFPTTHPFRNCVRSPSNISTRYVYLMGSQPGVPLPFSDVIKYDLETGMVFRWHCEAGSVGEPCFVPRLGKASAWYGDEDDGWIVVQVYLYEKNQVQFCILDAMDISKGPICRLNMPFHVPFGFHGTYTEEVFVKPTPKL